ncbi:MAG: cellulase family glycosylhydrolase [Puniceicoccaceae bacterium]
MSTFNRYLPVFLILGIIAPMSIQANKIDWQEYNLGQPTPIQPLNSSEIKASPWGLQFNGMPFHNNTIARWEALDVRALKAGLPYLINKTTNLGVKWVRVSVDWPLVEDDEGEFHWELLDPMIDGLVNAGIEVYISLHAGHKAHTKGKAPMTDKERSAWLNYAERVAQRYGDRIDYWEIWNEPNTVWFWPRPVRAEDYFILVKQASKMLRKVDPGCKIIGGSLARIDVPYTTELFSLGIAKYIDVLSYHPYGTFPESSLRKINVQVATPTLYTAVSHQVEDLQKLINESGRNIELWQGECGYPSAMNSLGWNGLGPFDEAVQAKWILRRGFSDLASGAEVSAFFILKDFLNTSGNKQNYKGLLDLENQPKKAYHVLQNLCSTVRGDLTVRINEPVDITIEDDGGMPGIIQRDVRSVILGSGSTLYIAYWAETHLQKTTAPGSVSIEMPMVQSNGDIQLTDLFNGQTSNVKSTTVEDNRLIISDLPLCDFPYVLKIDLCH